MLRNIVTQYYNLYVKKTLSNFTLSYDYTNNLTQYSLIQVIQNFQY